MAWLFDQISSLGSSRGLNSPPATAQFCRIQANGQAVRFRLDGGVPTATVGERLTAGGDVLELNDLGDMLNFRAIEEASGATLACHFQLSRV